MPIPPETVHVAAIADGAAARRFGGVAAIENPVRGTGRLCAREQTPGSLTTCGGGCPEFNGPVVNKMFDINIVDGMLTMAGREGSDEIFDRPLGKR